MNALMKISQAVIFAAFLFHIAAGSSIIPLKDSQPKNGSNSSSMNTANLKKDLISALHRGDMEKARNFVKAGALEEYLVGKDHEQRKMTMEKVYTKIRKVKFMLLTGITVININGNDINSPSSSKGSFEVFLVPGTDFTLRLQVNVTAVKNWGTKQVEDGRKPLHIICMLPDVHPETVKVILENGNDDVNVKTDSEATALLFASSNGNLDLVKFLVEKGARVNDFTRSSLETTNRGSYYAYEKIFSKKGVVIPENVIYCSPLAAAVWEDHLDIVRYLINKGADVNNGGQSWGVLFNPVFYGNIKAVEILVQNGIDVNAKDMLGTTALHIVAEWGGLEIAKVLLKHGANVNVTDTIGWTPLHVASFYSNKVGLPLINLLLESGSSLKVRTEGGHSPLNLLMAGGNLDFLEYLVRKFDTLNSTSRHTGLKEVDSDEKLAQSANLLISRGASFNDQDDILGWSPLHWAAASGDLRLAELLLDYGAVVSTRSKMGLTPYETAKYFGRRTVADFLSRVKDLVH